MFPMPSRVIGPHWRTAAASEVESIWKVASTEEGTNFVLFSMS